MRSSIRLGKIRGIEIGIHYSWFLVFALVLVSLAVFFFPVQYPGLTLGAYWVMGIVTTLLFFASVLGHELCHSLVAVSKGIPVRSIVLFIFGGVSQIEREADKPSTELLVAAVGPLSSIGFGIVFGAIWYLVTPFSAPIGGVAFYLATVNVFLGLFNLIPGFPLDGGRVLRAIIWARTGSMKRATRIAARIGQYFSYLFILAGAFYALVLGDLISGIWIAFIGWFLNNAASGSYQQAAVQDLMKGSDVEEIMERDFETVSPDLSVEDLVENHVLKHGQRAFPVTVGNNDLAGIITLVDIKGLPRERWATTRVSDVMTKLDKLRIVHPRDDLASVVNLMDGTNINQIPVTENGRLVGIVSRTDIVRFFSVRRELGIEEEGTELPGKAA
jgi:Zn-dependent protease/predicted transcriptional regulator